MLVHDFLDISFPEIFPSEPISSKSVSNIQKYSACDTQAGN